MRKLSTLEIARIAVGLATIWPTLRRAEYWPPPRLQAWQLRRLRRLIAHAHANVPFYRRLYDEAGVGPSDLRTIDDLRRFPIVTKDQVIENYPHDMLARGLKPDDLVVSRSSGSSGKVLDIAYDGRAMVTYVLAVAAAQLRDPLAGRVEIEAFDRAQHDQLPGASWSASRSSASIVHAPYQNRSLPTTRTTRARGTAAWSTASSSAENAWGSSGSTSRSGSRVASSASVSRG